MTNKDAFLHELASETFERAHFIFQLLSAAKMLEGGLNHLDEKTRHRLFNRTASRLREAAQCLDDGSPLEVVMVQCAIKH